MGLLRGRREEGSEGSASRRTAWVSCDCSSVGLGSQFLSEKGQCPRERRQGPLFPVNIPPGREVGAVRRPPVRTTQARRSCLAFPICWYLGLCFTCVSVFIFSFEPRGSPHQLGGFERVSVRSSGPVQGRHRFRQEAG